MKRLRKAIIRRNERVIRDNDRKNAENEEIIKGTRQGRLRRTRRAWRI